MARQLRDGSWDLVLLDLVLPDMDGREAARQLRELGFHSPIVMLTGHDSEADGLLLERVAGAGRDRHGHLAGVRGADRDAGGGDLVLGLVQDVLHLVFGAEVLDQVVVARLFFRMHPAAGPWAGGFISGDA